ncbi:MULTISPECIES: cytidine deaminase [Sphingobium]|uniref:Cytidine deaminase n=1 Tax=Sphingobium tyrosinilyticum TaxID=2715436 RepID=A0ABV9EZV4_9SPHN|nr:cytidine deaminase [Sphingobium sp. EP60837]ANI76878.1 Cytidine deaminase [Sphingobium sp. EP60837]
MSVDEAVKELVEAAQLAKGNAYAPYSRFAVGAAVRLTDGTIIGAANFENASYGLSLCAETVALAAANAQGRLGDVEAIAVVGGDTAPVTPCGRCRQILNEAEQVAARPIAIYCATRGDDSVVTYSVAELLPFAFGTKDLGCTSSRTSQE